MQTISLNAIAAAKTVAEMIEGFGSDPEGVVLTDPDTGAETNRIRPCGQYCDQVEVRLAGSARVMIDRPRFAYGDTLVPASARWSSSSSVGDLADARHTVKLLAFAVEVADQLNEWADRGELPRLLPPAERGATAETHGATDPDLFVGSLVDLRVAKIGGRESRHAGTLRGKVVAVGAEVDVAIDLEMAPEVDWVLQRSGADFDVNDLVETIDGREVIVLRNNQREQVTLAD